MRSTCWKKDGAVMTRVWLLHHLCWVFLWVFFFFILIAPLDSSHSRGEWSSQIWLFVKDYQMRKRKAFAKGNGCWHSWPLNAELGLELTCCISKHKQVQTNYIFEAQIDQRFEHWADYYVPPACFRSTTSSNRPCGTKRRASRNATICDNDTVN